MGTETVLVESADIDIESLNLPHNAVVTWRVEDAPSDINDLANLAIDAGFEPAFITVVPQSLRFTHRPVGPQIECPIEGGVVFVTA